MKWSLLLLLFAFEASAELRPFTTDGCSYSRDGTRKDPTKYQACCKLHDYEYWIGGTKEQRLEADLEFRQCILEVSGSKRTAAIYYRGPRLFAGPRPFCSFCWGYGWKPRRKYAPLTEEEARQVPEMTKEEILSTPVTLRRKSRKNP